MWDTAKGSVYLPHYKLSAKHMWTQSCVHLLPVGDSADRLILELPFIIISLFYSLELTRLQTDSCEAEQKKHLQQLGEIQNVYLFTLSIISLFYFISSW